MRSDGSPACNEKDDVKEGEKMMLKSILIGVLFAF